MCYGGGLVARALNCLDPKEGGAPLRVRSSTFRQNSSMLSLVIAPVKVAGWLMRSGKYKCY